MKTKIHAAAGAVALLTVGCFWTFTVLAELSDQAETMATANAAVLAFMAALIPAMIIAGGMGFSLAKGWKNHVVQHKKCRMRIVVPKDLLIILPSAYVLAGCTEYRRFDSTFFVM